MDLLLGGRRAVVTGAGDGIGRATAITLAAEGVESVLVGRSADTLADTAAAVTAAGGTATIVTGDLSSTAEVARVVDAARDQLGAIDILVNTVGPFPPFPVPAPLYGDDDGWRFEFDNVVLNFVALCRAVLPPMKEAGRGAVVNVAAQSARWYHARTAHYSAMKSAVTHVTKNYARDVAPFGVRVNSVHPGWIKKEAVAARVAETARQEGRTEQEVEQSMVWGSDGPPLYWAGRMGTPQEYADVITFLVSDRAGYVNGAVIAVDGGTPVG